MRVCFHGIAVVLAASFVPACKGSNSSASPVGADSASATASASATRPAAAGPTASDNPLAIPGATAVTMPNMPFPERFAAESKARPPGIKPTVEAVYAALGAAGFTIVDQKQHLASPLGARYCVGARAVAVDDAGKNDVLLEMSVCECSTPEVAKIARDYSARTMNPVIPLRTLYVNKQTLLVVREEKKTPEIDALAVKASALFAKL